MTRLWLPIILLLAFVDRLILLNQSLWWDEAINIVAAKENSFVDFVSRYPIGDFHPPGFFGLIWVWGRLFGFSEISMRMPSVIFGVLAVWLTFLIAGELFDKKIARWSALLMAVSPLLIYYSQEARMYSLAVLAVLLSSYFLVSLLKLKKWAGAGFILSNVLVLYSDYLAYLILPAQLLFVAIWYSRKLKIILGHMLVSGLFWLPWLPVFLKQLSTGQDASQTLVGWKEVVGGASLKEIGLIISKSIIGKISFSNKLVYGLIVGTIACIQAGIIWVGWRDRHRESNFLVLWIVVPIFLAYLISFWIPILSYFRVIYVMPAVYILISVGLSKLKSIYVLPLLTILVASSLVWLIIFWVSVQYQREDWRGVASYLSSRSQDQSVVMFEDTNIPAPIRYYAHMQSSLPGLVKVPAGQGDLVDLTAKLQDVKKVYLVDYLVEINDPNRLLDRQLKANGFVNIDTTNFNGVGFVRSYDR